ncbi:hypothetical protein [Streptomyces sp. NPDC058548]|uniref:hypothetical protein n=1 Tax=unclassified Streptomyces TaxID=2593676 RepID=UPI00366233DF
MSGLGPLAAGEGVGGRAAVLVVDVHEDAGALAGGAPAGAEAFGDGGEAGVVGADGEVEEIRPGRRRPRWPSRWRSGPR